MQFPRSIAFQNTSYDLHLFSDPSLNVYDTVEYLSAPNRQSSYDDLAILHQTIHGLYKVPTIGYANVI